MISVIMPAYNRSEYIGAAIESVLAQERKDFELIIVDDGSTDDTASVVARYPSVRYVCQSNQGISAARNKGLALARGEWIAWIDSDDLWRKDKLQKQMVYLETHPDCRILFSGYHVFSEIPWEELGYGQRKLLLGGANPWCMATAVMNASLFKQYGGFSVNFPYAEDDEWLARLRIGGENFVSLQTDKLYDRRVHNGNISLQTSPKEDRIVEKVWASALRAVRLNQKNRGMEKPDENNPENPASPEMDF